MKSRSKRSTKRATEGLRKLRGSHPADADVVQLVRKDRESGRSPATAWRPRRELKLAMAILRKELTLVTKGEFHVSQDLRTAPQTRWVAMNHELARPARRTGIPSAHGVRLQPTKPLLHPGVRAKALGAFLDEWEREHGPPTSAELDMAAEELYVRRRPQKMKKGAKRECCTAADVLADVPQLGALGRKLRVVDPTKQARRRAETTPPSFSDHMLFQDLLSVAMHGLVAKKILNDPSLVERASNTLERWISKQRPVPKPFMEWRQILAGTPQEIAAVAVGLTEEATRLRSSSPLGCLLTKKERAAVRALFGRKGRGR